MSLTIDDCQDSLIPNPDSADVRRDSCRSSQSVPGESRFLNTDSLLELGGRAVSGSWWPSAVATRQQYNGCIKNLKHNGEVVIGCHWLPVSTLLLMWLIVLSLLPAL